SVAGRNRKAAASSRSFPHGECAIVEISKTAAVQAQLVRNEGRVLAKRSPKSTPNPVPERVYAPLEEERGHASATDPSREEPEHSEPHKVASDSGRESGD